MIKKYIYYTALELCNIYMLMRQSKIKYTTRKQLGSEEYYIFTKDEIYGGDGQ